MARHIARYQILFGLTGCYMPDSNCGPYYATTKRELQDLIIEQSELFDFPKSTLRQVALTRLWDHIKAHGSSVAHFSIDHKGNTLSFVGLTEEEAQQMEEQENW